MLLFSYFSEGAQAPTVPALSLSAVSPPHLVLGAPAAGPSRAARAAPSPRNAKLTAAAAPPPAPPQSRGPAPGRSRSGASGCGGTAHNPLLQLLPPPSAYTGGEGEGRQGKAQVQSALTCSPSPSAASAVSVLIPRADGASAAKCRRDAPRRGGGGLQAAGRPPGMGAVRPPAHSPAPAEMGALPLLRSSSSTARRGTAPPAAGLTMGEVGAGAKPSSDWVRIVAAGGGGRGGREGTRREGEGRGGGDAALGRG